MGGKTGTTNDSQDTWFIGFTPYLLSGVYVGFDELQPMGRRETGGTTACPIFVKYRKEVEETYPLQEFQKPDNVVFEEFASGEAEGGASYTMPFITGTEPSVSGQRRESSSAISEQEDMLLKQMF